MWCNVFAFYTSWNLFVFEMCEVNRDIYYNVRWQLLMAHRFYKRKFSRSLFPSRMINCHCVRDYEKHILRNQYVHKVFSVSSLNLLFRFLKIFKFKNKFYSYKANDNFVFKKHYKIIVEKILLQSHWIYTSWITEISILYFEIKSLTIMHI